VGFPTHLTGFTVTPLPCHALPRRASPRLDFRRENIFFVSGNAAIFGCANPLTVIDATEGFELRPHLLAEMVAMPSVSPVANPVAVIDTTEVSELLQITEAVMSFPKLSIAVNCT
jgi:hypothetical protein